MGKGSRPRPVNKERFDKNYEIIFSHRSKGDKQKKWGCESWMCQQCKHYYKYLTVSSSQDLCRNKGCFYEEGKAIND